MPRRSGSSRTKGAIVAPEPDTEDDDATALVDSDSDATRATLTAASLAAELARVIHGQDAALERVASVTVAQLRKRHPARPGSVVLLGPTGAGKTATVEALPAALSSLGYDGARVFRLDCGELTDSIQLTRLLGSPPGYSGHAATTPLLTALERPGCILLVDEVEKAHPDLLDLLLGLLDAGRLSGPAGQDVDARHVVVAMTTSLESDELLAELGSTPLADRWAVQRTCAEHLRGRGLPPDLVGRIGAFAAYGDLDGDGRPAGDRGVRDRGARAPSTGSSSRPSIRSSSRSSRTSPGTAATRPVRAPCSTRPASCSPSASPGSPPTGRRCR